VAHDLDAKSIVSGLRELATHGRFWVMCASFAVPMGVYDGWLNILDINLKNLDNFDQSHAGWIGFGSVMGGCMAGVISGRIADIFPGHIRQIIMVLYVCATLCFGWFTLTCWKVLPFSLASVYVSTCAAGFFMYGTSGLYFELAIEVTFPISDACVASVLSLSQAVFSSVFLTIPVGETGTNWMNPTLCVCPLLAVVVLACFPDRYQRLKLDAGSQEDPGAMQYVASG
jgi:FLVCR family MFS transporter